MASIHPNGLVGLSILIQIGQLSNSVLRKITEVLPSIQYRGMVLVVVLCRVKSLKIVQNFSKENHMIYFYLGNKHNMENVTVSQILPETQDYMTYEGSETEPGCSETVTWIIMNRPIYITHKQVM